MKDILEIIYTLPLNNPNIILNYYFGVMLVYFQNEPNNQLITFEVYLFIDLVINSNNMPCSWTVSLPFKSRTC